MDGGNPTITLHCLNVVDNLIELHSDPNFCEMFPKFIFDGEFADDEDGPKREVYNLFWDNIIMSNFEGGSSVVPVLGPDTTDNIIKILGCVALHGYICCGFFPTKILKVFLKVVMFGPSCIDEPTLIEGVLVFVTDVEWQFLMNCMQKETLHSSGARRIAGYHVSVWCAIASEHPKHSSTDSENWKM